MEVTSIEMEDRFTDMCKTTPKELSQSKKTGAQTTDPWKSASFKAWPKKNVKKITRGNSLGWKELGALQSERVRVSTGTEVKSRLVHWS